MCVACRWIKCKLMASTKGVPMKLLYRLYSCGRGDKTIAQALGEMGWPPNKVSLSSISSPSPLSLSLPWAPEPSEPDPLNSYALPLGPLLSSLDLIRRAVLQDDLRYIACAERRDQ